ncbi:hypothetical protein C2G38_2046846 [Gigaspora rosea]|uniref:HCP-like protein n=1 Tax=Gigaspora rosea TaxID=44941 RepID=A0A397U7W0_9GLOM|nr:hypothetical protein C2G38_2046846 [Gigaspora rosea]
MGKKSPNYFSEIVKELYNLYNEERSKCSDSELIFNKLDQFLTKKKQNPIDIIKWCSDDQINPISKIILACCYRFGKWVKKDEFKAFIYYQKSADMEYAEGIFYVGVCYDEGIGVKKDKHKAFEYYKKSADMGNAMGMYNVGCCYDEGIGVEKDEYKAFEYYKKSADLGDVFGINNVGYCYQNGIGIEKDENKAFKYYQKSAEMGNASGTFNDKRNIEILVEL